MKIVSNVVILSALLSASAIASSNPEIFVDPVNGLVKGNGTIDRPFKSIKVAIINGQRKYNSGKDKTPYTIQLRAGTYTESINKNGLKSPSDQPIVIQAYNNEKVLFDGTIDISSGWQSEGHNIYSKHIGQDIWQLLVKENGQWQEKTNARWPNARFGEHKGGVKSVYSRESWAHANNKGNKLGLMVDDDLADDESIKNINLKDAIVVANVGSFNTWTRKITEHQAGDGFFKYQPTPSIWKKQAHFYYFIEGKKELLDNDDEWYFDKEAKTAYLYSSKGQPNQAIKAKHQAYAFDVKKWRNVTIKGVDFFAETIRCNPCERITIEDANFDYSGSSRRVLGKTTAKADILYISADKNNENQDTYHTLRNIKMNNVDGQGFFIRGNHSLVENSLFSKIDWASTETYSPSSSFVFAGNYSTLRYNTIHMTGTSETIVTTGARPVGEGEYKGPKGGVITAEYNDISNTGFAQSDGAMIQLRVAAQNGSIIQYNWLHDSVKYGVRFDAPIPAVRYGSHALTQNNVLWHTKGMMVKGVEQTVLNNLVFDSNKKKFTDLIVLNNSDANGVDGGGCRRCKIENNVADVISSQRAKFEPLPKWIEAKDNYSAETDKRSITSILKDSTNHDFRIVDKNVVAQGAYLSEADNYWIPGRREMKTSYPIPAMGNKEVSVTADLIWRPSYEGVSYNVYFGEKESALKLVGNLKNNVFKPSNLKSGVAYYWRADAVDNKGDVVKGDVWHFKTR